MLELRGVTAGYGSHTVLRDVNLVVPDNAMAQTRAILAHADGPLVGIHVSGGRQSKQWHLARFAEVARSLVENPWSP